MDMNTGFLFFDSDPKKDLQQKIRQAQSDFLQKFGHKAEYCLVNGEDAFGINLEEIGKACGLIVQSYKFVMPHNLWVGFEGMDVRERA